MHDILATFEDVFAVLTSNHLVIMVSSAAAGLVAMLTAGRKS